MKTLVSFDDLKIGEFYGRVQLTQLWGYKGYQALSRGVITPTNTNIIVLFVTKDKQASLTQYNDYISDGFLYWDGEEKGANNQRIINSSFTNDEIHLFYRYKHHTDFNYLGIVELVSYIENKNSPFQFIFQILGSRIHANLLREPEFNYGNGETQKRSITLSRIGQGEYRVNLLKLWKSCSVTGVDVPEVLKASHIKPWKNSNNFERLDPYNGLILTPTLDTLFDRGFITFENDGCMVLSKKIEPYSSLLNISPEMHLRTSFEKNVDYLQYHRDRVYLHR